MMAFISPKSIRIQVISTLILFLLVCHPGVAAESIEMNEVKQPRDLNSFEEYTALHYWPQEKFLGDTICFYGKGEYHIFFLAPRGPVKQLAWAHISSTDLIHWKELPDALLPPPDPKAPDGSGCWTGSIIEKDGLFYCFYTGYGVEDPVSTQKVMLATSKDLITWEKDPTFILYPDGEIYYNTSINGPWPASLPPDGPQGFRDSEVFWNPDLNKYSMLLHTFTAQEPHGVFGHYTSEDLRQWKAEPPLPGLVGGDCPYMMRHQNEWYLIQHMSYSRSKSIEGPFTRQAYDHGLFAVPKGMYDGKRYLLYAWINTLKDPKNPTLDYTDAAPVNGPGILSLPREIHFGSDGQLLERFPKEILDYFDHVELDQQNIEAGKGQELFFDTPKNYFLHGVADMKNSQQHLKIHFRKNKEESDSGYTIDIDLPSHQIGLVCKGYQFKKTSWQPDLAQPIDIKLFVLGTCVECIINDSFGFTGRAYDYTNGALSLEAVGEQPVRLQQLQVKTASESK